VKSSYGEVVTKVKKRDSELVTCDEFTVSRVHWHPPRQHRRGLHNSRTSQLADNEFLKTSCVVPRQPVPDPGGSCLGSQLSI